MKMADKKNDTSSTAQTSCSLCEEPDSSEMVQCDVCDKWFHYKCVGVSADIANEDWSCGRCRGTNETVTSENHSTSDGKRPSPVNEHGGGPRGVGMRCTDKSSGVVAKSSSKNRRNLEIELQRLEEERKLNMSFIERKYAIMGKLDDDDESDEVGVRIECEQQLRSAEDENANRTVTGVCAGNINNSTNAGASDFYELGDGSVYQRVIGHQNLSATIQRPTSAFLRQDQVYSRQVIPRELPVFSGKPEEWPLFISSYENSTNLCGFSNEENLLRLQRALRGKALEYVSSKLTIPALVPEVVSTLRMLFGRPENIIHNLLTKLRAGPSVNANKLDTLVHFSLDVKNIVATMEAANLNAHLCNPMLIQEFIERLPAQMRLQWAVHARNINVVNLTEFSNWLFTLAEAASSVISILNPSLSTQDNEKRKTPRVNVHEERNNENKDKPKRSTETKCFGCDETGHFIASCEKFRKLDYNGKWNLVHERKLCRSCLKLHDLRFCRERRVCAVNECTAKHHPSLHKPEVTVDSVRNTTTSVVAVHRMTTSNVLYRFVPITIYGKNTSVNEYALLDEASGPTLIQKSVLEKLDIHGVQSEFCMSWTDKSIRVENNSDRVDLKISPLGRSETQFLLKNVRSVSELDLPKQTLMFSELAEKYKYLRGLPVESYENMKPKIIIGLNNKHVAMPLKYKEGGEDEPAALKTRLGWTIYGTNGSEVTGSKNVHNNVSLQLHICECDNDVALHKLMKQNLQLENDEVKVQGPCSNHDINMQNYATRTNDKFTVKLLWKADNLTMPNNYEMALRRLQCFERKLEKDQDLKIRVNDHIKSMLSKGYIRKLNEVEYNIEYPRKWYLPIFVVKNPNKPDKIRLVWDAAAEHHGVSLNSNLDKGPDFLTPLINVIFNFRVGKVGISGDISEMFHRVAVDQEDCQSQRFLWRSCNNEKEPDVFVLQVMSFGASCSPSLAQYVKNNNAKEFEQEFPRAAKSITERHYVDDMLDSVDTIEEAIQLAQQVREVHRRGNFYIRNWMSNSKEVVAAMGDEYKSESFCQAGKKIEHVIEPEKVLGMWWRTSDDVFTYNLKFTKANGEILSGRRLPTKRELLRLLMSIFDPLGLLSFYTVHMKILLQNVWRKGIMWDETISDEFSEEWLRWLSLLNNVENVKVPRCYFKMGCSQKSIVQLHILVDASENAYAAVAYFRIQTHDKIETSLVASKTKVAPLRPVSIPRMELLAAVLGARLAATISNGHDLRIESTHFWTDSKTVLLWLRSDPRRYKQFVMFRVAEIQEITDISKWSYVPSKANVADLATKWARQPSFDSPNSWFTGPSFLSQPPNEWPKSESENKHHSEVSISEIQHVAVHVQQNVALIDFTRFSKYERLLRSMAYVRRFVDQKISSKFTSNNVDLTSEQLHWSQQYLVRLVQSHAYSNEIILLQRSPSCVLPKLSRLRKLSPFLDENMILRLRGRLENATIITDETKNPIILPRNHHITHLLVDWYHRKYKHVHHETVINEIFQKYHIPGLRTLLRTVRKNCMMCRIRNSQPNPPEMGPLPVARVSAFCKPFSHVGLDFFGPFIVTVGRRSEKRYGAIFTCLTIRAVHIEMVYRLDMNSCVMAIRNFIARRGVPLHMYSDNGTNLKAAEKELRESLRNIDFQSLHNEFTSPNTSWSFIPPASPHMGGAWERMVRSVKTVLYQIITPDHKLNEERLHNLFLEVENIINTRPLTYLSLESADQEALTPNHFLLGASSGDKPPGRFDESDMYLRKSWRHAQLLADKFWKRWVAEVLPTMTKRAKWFEKVKPIEVGDIVIIVDSNLPRHCWPKGIVTETINAKDGQVRSAIVKTTSGVYHRPAAKIAVLDIRSEK